LLTLKDANVSLNFSNLNNLLLSFKWYNFLSDSDVDILLDKFNTKINEFMIRASKKCIISKNKFKKSQKYKAWVTNGLLVSINNRHKLYLKNHKGPFDFTLKDHYIKYSRVYSNIGIWHMNKLKIIFLMIAKSIARKIIALVNI